MYGSSRKLFLLNNRLLFIYNKKSMEKRIKIKYWFMVMLMFIVLIYVLLNVFFLVLIVSWKDDFEFWIVSNDVIMNIFIILRRLFFVNNIVNFFLYGYFDLIFRCKVKELFGIKFFKIV